MIYHLSDIDLDGYSCQFAVSLAYPRARFYNAPYGKAFHEAFFLIIDEIARRQAEGNCEENIIVLSDSSPSEAYCKEFEEAVKTDVQNTKLLLLDHHASGTHAGSFPWFYLDVKRSAGKITADFVQEMTQKPFKPCVQEFFRAVNAADIWLKEDSLFEFGKVAQSMVAGAKEVNRVMFGKKHWDYMFYLLQKACDLVSVDDAHIRLDSTLHEIKKSYFRKDKDDTLSNLVSSYVVDLLCQMADALSINWRGKKGILTSNIGVVSVIGNDFLVAKPDFDFFIDVTSRKSVSLRANGNCDVNHMANVLFGGGGHVNASGGSFASFKDSANYKDIKTQFEHLLRSKE